MKNVFLTLAMCVSFSGMAQVFNVGTVTPVLEQDSQNAAVAISPKGDYLLLSTTSNKGLIKLDLATKQTQELSTAPGAGFDVKISEDGENVIFRENTFDKKHLRYTTLNSVNVTTGARANVVSATRNLQGVQIEGATAKTVNKGKMKVKSLDGSKVANTLPVLSIDNRQLMITRNGKTTLFSPNGTNTSYLWPSLSPDGTKVLYYVAGNGAWVCDLNGQNKVKVGIMRAPVWYDNETVIGMLDEDDGEFIYASSIVAATLDGRTQELVSRDNVAMYPLAANGKIAYTTAAGHVYVMEVTK